MELQSKDMLFRTLAGFIVILAILLIYSIFWGPIRDYTSSLTAARTMAVSVSDKVTAVPDIAQVSFSVITEGPSIAKITDDNNAKVNKAIDMVKSNGVADSDIETTEYNLTPVYTQPVGTLGSSGTFTPTIAKYSLTQTIQIKIRDFTKISLVLDALPGLGINRIGNISFTIDDPETYYAQAREKAFKKAETKAESMASQNGVSLGKIVSISDYPQNAYPIYRESAMGVGGAAIPSVAPQIQPGSQDVSVNVTVVYEIR